MEILRNLFNINSTFFQIFDYPMSYLEFFGTILTIWCVLLTAKAKILSWPIGLLGSILYLAMFYQIQLYSDLLEQIYFIITGLIGWYMWVQNKKEINKQDQTVLVGLSNLKEHILYAVIIVVGTVILSFVTINLNNWLPQYFPEPVSLPVLDALTTIMSFLAQWLLMKKKIESWILWIIVDAIAIGLYWYKGIKFVSLEYLLFFFIAIFGLLNWVKIYRKHNSQKHA